ncbi:MAG: 3-hydroxyacyl-CoA dehydrogenase NAD-binding domain-containing protein, partial [Specibacter sp.]
MSDTVENTEKQLQFTVVGSGYMGGGIAQVLALGGARVALSDVSAEIAAKNYERLLVESD